MTTMSDGANLPRQFCRAIATVVTVGAVAITTAITAPAASAHTARTTVHASQQAAALQSVSVFSNPAAVTSTTGRKLFLSLYASRETHGPAPTVQLDVSRQSKGSTEQHGWQASVGNSALVVKGTSGKITVSSKQFASYGQVHLTIGSAGKTVRSGCAINYSLSTPVTLRGTVLLRTKSKAWGDVGSTRRHFSVKAYLDRTYGTAQCHMARICDKFLDWSASYPEHGGASLFVGGYGSPGSASLSSTRTLPLTASVSRTDTLSATPGSQLLAGSGLRTKLFIATKRGTLASGSAVLQAIQKPSPSGYSCRFHGKTHKGSARFFQASFAAKGFVFHAQVFGSMKIRSSRGGFVSVDSFS